MEQTLVIIKPSAVERGLIGEIITRFQRKGLNIAGLKMMQLGEDILREHYAHLVDRPFFPWDISINDGNSRHCCMHKRDRCCKCG